MAGDWMKVELHLLDKPEVFQISASLGIDRYAVVGRLIAIWAWFDQHTVDGNAPGVTNVTLDHLTNTPGFGEALKKAAWLVEDVGGKTCIVMPKFDAHTSESAKKRALSAKRQSRFRNASSNAEVTHSALPREEKSIGDISKKELLTPPAKKNGKGMLLQNYPGFVRFWEVWPQTARKGGKAKCLETWAAKGYEAQADIIVSHVERQKKTEGWQTGYDPMPVTYLNQGRWDGADEGEKMTMRLPI